MKFFSSIRGGVFLYLQLSLEILECLGGIRLCVPLCDRYSYHDVTQLPLLDNNVLASLDWFDRTIGPAGHCFAYFLSQRIVYLRKLSRIYLCLCCCKHY